MSGLITAPPFNNMFEATRDNSTMQGLVTAIYEIGCLLGAMFILAVGDLLGRRKAIILGAVIMLLGVIIQITVMPGSTPLAQFIVGRVIMGVGNGINTSTIPTYQAECSKTSNRGLLICIEGGVIAFGTLIAYWIDYGASFGPDDLSWRFPIAFQVIFALIIFIPMIFLPESPRWLLSHGRVADADKVISALRGYEITSAETAQERDGIVDSLRASGGVGQKSTPVKLLFTNGKTQHFRRMLLGVSSQLMQQLGGMFFPVTHIIFTRPVKLTPSSSTRLQRCHLLHAALAGKHRLVAKHESAHWRSQYDCLRHICYILLVLHRAYRPASSVSVWNRGSDGQHDHCVCLLDSR